MELLNNLLRFSNEEIINKLNPVNNLWILEYVKRRTKAALQIFLNLASEAWIVCRLLSKVKNELKIYIIYICDFGIEISITHVCILTEELFDFKGHLKELQKLSVTKIY